MTLADQWGPTIKQAAPQKRLVAFVNVDHRLATIGVQFFIYYTIKTSVGAEVGWLSHNITQDNKDMDKATKAIHSVLDCGSFIKGSKSRVTVDKEELVVGKYMEWGGCQNNLGTALSDIDRVLRPFGFATSSP